MISRQIQIRQPQILLLRDQQVTTNNMVVKRVNLENFGKFGNKIGNSKKYHNNFQ